MGKLVDGVWKDVWYDTEKTKGKFVRSESQFRNWVTADGEAGPTGDAGFKAESGRYHLYVSYACPWAHRTLIFRELKGLAQHIEVTAVDPLMREEGWTLKGEMGGETDPLYGKTRLYEIYTKADPHYSGRVTVPVLWDKQKETIASNESADIIRMFNSAFDALPGVNAALDFHPADLREEIGAINARVYDEVNNGVYKAGFATSQDAYEEAVTTLFKALDWLDGILTHNRYLLGSRITEADWRLFTTLVRFDAVYVGHFKCNIRRIADYPALSGYLRELYQMEGVKETVRFDHIKQHYYGSHKHINPTGIVPVGPALNLDAPHERDALPKDKERR
ncbi:glutathione S-transferase family protein [Tepidicaulis sp. LMO-SS28]|uniref:glutathione S-transferase family protein n=1 Tax=Tepidicaulis sp. LMO-SS28 TaxID=3447455 RepID=UPI003EDF0000